MFEFLKGFFRSKKPQVNLWESIPIHRRTPDIAKLEKSQYQLLFVGDDWRLERSNYKLLKDHSAFVTRAFTNDKFDFYDYTVPGQDPLPIPLLATTGTFHPVPIYGDVHIVESSHFVELDIARDNGVKFLRKRMDILVPHRYILKGPNVDSDRPFRKLPLALQGKTKGQMSPEHLYPLTCWMYVGNPEYWEDLIDGGFLFTPVYRQTPIHKKDWVGEYFNYPKHEEKS